MAVAKPMHTSSFSDNVLGLARLFRIEARRSLGFCLLPLLVGVAWYTSRERTDDGVAVWVEDSRRIGFALVLLGPLLGGLAAWEAGREERSRLGELGTTVSRPPIWRDLCRWAAITGWGVLAYLIAGSYIFLLALRDATWGGPLLLPILVGFVGLIAYSAVGFAIGTLVPGRFIVPLVPVILYFAEALPTGLRYTSESPTQFLTPWTFLDRLTVPIQSAAGRAIGWNVIIWMLGLTGVMLAIVAVWQRTEAGAVVGLACSVIVAATGGFLLLGTSVGEADTAVPLPPPKCTERGIEVCLHPAYEAVLDDTAALIDVLIEPLIGVPGAPTQAMDFWYSQSTRSTDDVLLINPFLKINGTNDTAQQFVRPLISKSGSRYDSGACETGFRNAQHAISVALLQRGGWEMETGPNGPSTCETFELQRRTRSPDVLPWENPAVEEMQADIKAAADRFAALSVEEQRAWFMTHYADLRAGNLTLEDLP